MHACLHIHIIIISIYHTSCKGMHILIIILASHVTQDACIYDPAVYIYIGLVNYPFLDS